MDRTQALTTYEVLAKYNNLQLYSSLEWSMVIDALMQKRYKSSVYQL